MLPTVLCLLPDRAQAEGVVAKLHAAEVPAADIAALVQGREGDLPAQSIGGLAPKGGAKKEGGVDSMPSMAQGAVAGGLFGILGAALALTIPGLQPLILAAPVAAAIGGASGASAGALADALEEFGIPEEDLSTYEAGLEAGGCLLAVRTEDEAALARARKVFEANGAQDVALFRKTKRLL